MTEEQFTKVCDRFTNKKIFQRNADGSLKKDRHGNLQKLNYDNPPAAANTATPANAAATR